jgi:hypothetical protein
MSSPHLSNVVEYSGSSDVKMFIVDAKMAIIGGEKVRMAADITFNSTALYCTTKHSNTQYSTAHSGTQDSPSSDLNRTSPPWRSMISFAMTSPEVGDCDIMKCI